MNDDNADNSLVSLTLPESVENEVHAVNSSLSNASSFLPAKRGFKMACLNIYSLVKHIDELRVLLSEFSVDILAINETKLDESIKSSELHIPGYEFIRRDRSRNGGGVGFYIKSSNYSRFAYGSFRLLSVRLCLESIRLRPICQFAYVLNSVL